MSEDRRGRPTNDRKAMAVYLLSQVGYTVKELAEWFNVTERHVRRLITGK